MINGDIFNYRALLQWEKKIYNNHCKSKAVRRFEQKNSKHWSPGRRRAWVMFYSIGLKIDGLNAHK